MGEEKVLLMMRKTPLRHNRTPTAHNPGHPFRRHRNKPEQHSRMNRKIIHTLLRLLDQSVAKYIPS